MARGWWRAFGAVVLIGLSPHAGRATDGIDDGPPLSPRNASYEIEATLDVEARLIRGRQTLTWRNIQNRPTDELWFHLYWNAWRNSRSSWLLEDRIGERSEYSGEPREGDWGTIDVESVALLAESGGAPLDLSQRMRFAAPDDGNQDDRTVLVVDLPRPVRPGQTIRVEMSWTARVPRTFARTGFRGDFYFLAHWFPKLGVFEGDGWSCNQYHARTEYYSDYGVYDVRLTLPSEYVMGATGREVERVENGDGTTTHRYRQADVHEFAWTASPDYLVREARFEAAGLPPVEMRLLIQPEHLGQAERHFEATRAALEHFGRWYGPYPYGHVTLVDTAYGSGAEGMEYPTFFTCGTRIFNPVGGDDPESVTVHEAGHQFWYGLVGNNEFEDAWLDEGLNTFSTIRTLEAAYAPRKYVERYLLPPGETDRYAAFIPVLIPDIEVPRLTSRVAAYRPSANADDQETASFRYYPATAYGISYSKTALWLGTLERHLGWETLQPILSTFFERYRFAHPTPEDFLAVADEVSGRDLGWFFDQVYAGSAIFDYSIASVASEPAALEGWTEREGEQVFVDPSAADEDEETVYRTEVAVRRLGDGRFPVDVLMVFEDGEEIRRSWDGQARWTLLVEERPAKLRSASVDPDRVLLLDVDHTNNSRLLEPDATLPAVKWASKWMIWLQDWMATFAFFI
jgi:hypothetical protein